MTAELPEKMMELTDGISAALALAEAITIDLPEPVPAELLHAITVSPVSRRDAAIRSARAAGLERVEQFRAQCAAVSNQVEFTLLEKTLQLFQQLKRVSGIARTRLADKVSCQRLIEDEISRAAARENHGRPKSKVTKRQELTTRRTQANQNRSPNPLEAVVRQG